MKCMSCGSEMRKSHANIAYTSLPGVTLAGVTIFRCSHCDEEEVAIPRIEALNRALARELVRKEGPLAPHEIRFLRKQLGWAGVDFARTFGVTPETVSRWESGAKPMGPVAERLLRLTVATTAPIANYAVNELTAVDAAPTVTTLTMKTTPKGWKKSAA